MKSVESKCGLSRIFTTFRSEECWVRISSTHALIYDKLLDMADFINDPDIPKAKKHRDLHAYHI